MSNGTENPRMDLKIDAEKNIAYIKLTGRLSKDFIRYALHAAVFDTNYKPGMGRLWDLSDADVSAFNSETIYNITHYTLSLPAGTNDVKVAMVVRRNIDYGLARMFEMLSKAKTTIRVFRSLGKAEAWMMEEV